MLETINISFPAPIILPKPFQELIELEASGKYEWEIKPSEVLQKHTRVELGCICGECYFGDAPIQRWERVIGFMNNAFPELGNFEIKEDRFGLKRPVSINSVELKSFLVKLQGLKEFNGISELYRKGELYCSFDFIDLPFSNNNLSDIKYEFKYVRLGLPKERIEFHKDLPNVIEFHEDTGGHDGIANGGSYGWYLTIYSNGNIADEVIWDHSSAQTGHRLNYHHDDICHKLHFEKCSWIMCKYWYNGLVYQYEAYYQAYGNVPKNYLKYKKLTI